MSRANENLARLIESSPSSPALKERPAFLRANRDSLAKWRAYRPERLPAIAELPRCDELVPLSGLLGAEPLSEGAREELSLGFIQFSAEFFSFFEQLFQICYFGLKGRLPEEHRLAFRKLAREEKAHSLAFQRFLRNEPRFGWPASGLLGKRRSLLKRAIAGILRLCPEAFLVQAAKLEFHSMTYSRALERSIGGECSLRFPPRDQWQAVNRMHLADETHHPKYVLDLYETVLAEQRGLRRHGTIALTVAIALLIQPLYILGGWRILQRAFPGDTRLTRLARLRGFVRWAETIFPPSVQTRHAFRRELESRGDLFRGALRIITKY